MIAVTEEEVDRVKQWIRRAAKTKAMDFAKDQYTHRQLRDFVTKDYYGVKSYRDLCTMMKAGSMPVKLITAKTGGIYDTRTPLDQSISFQDVLNLIGPFCKNETIQEKLSRKMEEMGSLRFNEEGSLRARTAAWRVGRDIFDRIFVVLFDYPHGQRMKPEIKASARLNLDIKNDLITGMAIAFT